MTDRRGLRVHILLLIAIAGELVGTTSLKLANGFQRPLAWLGVLGGYGTAFWLLTLVIQKIDMGVTYALWSGLGILMAVAVGALCFGESLSWMRVLGIVAIALGVVLIEIDPNRSHGPPRDPAVINTRP